MLKQHKNLYKSASKARTIFQPRVHYLKMGKGGSSLAFRWSRSHDHTTVQSYLFHYQLHYSILLHGTQLATHGTR